MFLFDFCMENGKLWFNFCWEPWSLRLSNGVSLLHWSTESHHFFCFAHRILQHNLCGSSAASRALPELQPPPSWWWNGWLFLCKGFGDPPGEAVHQSHSLGRLMPAEEHAHHGYKMMGAPRFWGVCWGFFFGFWGGVFGFFWGFFFFGPSVWWVCEVLCESKRCFSWKEGGSKAVSQVQQCYRGWWGCRGSVAGFLIALEVLGGTEATSLLLLSSCPLLPRSSLVLFIAKLVVYQQGRQLMLLSRSMCCSN